MDFDTDKSMFFILDEQHNPVPATVREWGEFRRQHKRVAFTQLPDCWVSTVFLGMDHGCYDKPLLFETMAFMGDYDKDGTDKEIGDDSTARYFTWDEALSGHEAMVKRLSEGKTEGRE